MTSTVAYL